MGKEIWKPVKGYENYYEVSNLGRVRGLPRTVKSKKRGDGTRTEHFLPIRILKPIKDRQGYLRVSLCVDWVTSKPFVHRLVGYAFIDNPENKREINHKNGIQWDNRLENLEWVTPSENQNHALKNGLKIPIKGESIGTSVLTEEQVKEIKKKLKEGILTQKKIGELYGVTKFTIQKINVGKNWKWVKI